MQMSGRIQLLASGDCRGSSAAESPVRVVVTLSLRIPGGFCSPRLSEACHRCPLAAALKSAQPSSGGM